MKSISKFNSEPFIVALKFFFEELKVPVNYLSDVPASPKDVLSGLFNKNNVAHNLIDDVFTFGAVDDAIFNQTRTFNSFSQVKKVSDTYNGLLIFGVTLQNREADLPITRSQLAEITRVFNRAFPHAPVAIVFKYNSLISFANTERIKYRQQWREGEKIGKVSLLKDINTLKPHRGHLSILQLMVIPTTGTNAVKSFNQLYYYWQSVFSLSVLNKLFYEDVIAWFNSAVNNIKIPGQDPASENHKDFTVRLIARLIFIWFLKELNVVKEELLLPEFYNGEENTLIKPKRKSSSYYKFVLQNLFFNALNSEQKERRKKVFDIYADDFSDSSSIKEAIFFSPYLNGGLFDIHPKDWCEFDNKNKHIVNNAFVVPDHLFLDKDNGLNGILSRYKFTIAENTPLEEEIAVDPEMLGRIFENLLAEQSDDTRDVARKNAGAFYTPRPVVSYMCRNTLLKHLNVEIKPENSKIIVKKLLETTVLDPACGSGAFPMGMLEEMMQILTAIDPGGKAWVGEMMKSKDDLFREHISEMFADGQIRYVKKLGLLRNCLFGVDILEYAIEITKLRCWLSLIVEQRVDFSKDNYNLKPLPNLEFKFYRKNSLFRYYKDQNMNELITQIDKNGLLKDLVNLENQYFITRSDNQGSKEEIKNKIVGLLEKVVDDKSENITKQLKSARTAINQLVFMNAPSKDIVKFRKKEKNLVYELSSLAALSANIKDYFIESVVFPGIFNRENKNPGFDIVVGNPPYVNTKLINKMGWTQKLEEEYGFCDDLYNHFTFRGLELLKSGGLLSYITSDTFLTLQTKKNMRMHFLGISGEQQIDQFSFEQQRPQCTLMEIINTPKAFAALVDTAVFTIIKEEAKDDQELVYVDIRKPNAGSFSISEEEWKQIRTGKENISGWERILERTFSSLNQEIPTWIQSHTCDGQVVYRDNTSSLLKFKISFAPYLNSINYSIFSPTEYNCRILEKIVKPARPIYAEWWSRIETSRHIENNRSDIKKFIDSQKTGSTSLIGLMTDGGQGLATGDNGRFVGYHYKSRFADRCKVTRIQKLWGAINDEPKIKQKFNFLAACRSVEDVENILNKMKEKKVWQLFDDIKQHFGLRIFGKGFLYRIIPEELIFDVSVITQKQKETGIKGKRHFVSYDKGEKEGHRWYSKSPYLIDWSEESVSILSTSSTARWQGYNFFFRNGFCWTNVLNPNSIYLKSRLKDVTVNDVGSMSLYDESGLGDKYLVFILNSYLYFKLLREFFNNTVNVQMNDIRKLPVNIPSEKELTIINQKFDECLKIKKDYFAGNLTKIEMSEALRPIESEIDEMVNHLYGIEAKEEIELDEEEEEILVEEEDSEDVD